MSEHTKKIPVIMDVDTGVDDTMALLVAAQSPRIDLLAATSTFGNTFTGYTTQNTLNALAICGRTDIPVASGTRQPWKKKLRTSPYIHGDTGIGDYVYPEDHREALTGEYAWDLTYRVLMESPEPVVYVSLAAMTNLATTLRKYPEVKSKIEKVVFMGGELRGNTAGSQCASVNIFHDPDSAQYVLTSGVPFHMCTGAAVTSRVLFSVRDLEEWFGGLETEKDRAVLTMLKFYFEKCGAFGEGENHLNPIHDPTTVMYLLEPECYPSVPCRCEVELEGLETYGYSLIDLYNIGQWPEKDFNIRYVTVRDDKRDYLAQQVLKGIKGVL